jgi:pimeloyl-ACP methyl ester carboxylesterase/DNA-binding CsgD family transcriptional regulator
MPERQDVRFCTSSDGVRLAYAAIGQGPPLVKAPNWLSHLEYEWKSPLWRHWLEGLSRRHTFIRYDARGCGLSDRDPAEVSLEAWVRDLEAVVDAAKLERFPLLGLSQGASIAIAYANRHPERVSHLILCGGFARGRLMRGYGQAGIDEAILLRKLIELGWGTSNRAFRQVFATQFLPGGSPEMVEEFDALQRHSSGAHDAVRIVDVAMQTDVSELARKVKCPTLVMHATNDMRIPFEEGRILASLIPGARFVPLEGPNHFLLEEEPAWAQFLEAFEAFLPAGAPREAFVGLTSRERETLEFLAQGLDNHQIAAHLELSEKTVRNMVTSILDKLEVESRSAAIVRARTAGFGTSVPGRP